MKNGMFVPVTRIQSSPRVKSDGKAHVDTGKPTLTQQGIDVDEFIRDNHALIERLRKGDTLKHEYTDGELAELKSIYDESGEAGLKEAIMTVTSKPAANKEEPMSQELTANGETAPEKQCENPRAIIANALIGIYDSISALQRAAYHANDKVVYMFATKLLNGELMDIKANYSKDVAK